MDALTSLPRSYEKLRERLAALPVSPGVYLFRDGYGQICYIGKSVCLRKRVRSYFYARRDDSSKLRRLRSEVRSVEWICTGSELEALLLESRLVKENQPRFNVLLRHYRHYPFIRVDLNDDYPRFEVTRHLERDGALYYGPFHSGRGVQEVIDALSDALRLRTCEGTGRRVPGSRPCLRRDLDRCLAPCTATGVESVYEQAVAEACGIFEGRTDRVFRIITDRMERAAAHLQFESAARLRDAFLQIRQLVGKQQALTSAVRNLNLIALTPSRHPDRVELFLFSHGRLVLQRELTRAQLEAEAGQEQSSHHGDTETRSGTRSGTAAEASLPPSPCLRVSVVQSAPPPLDVLLHDLVRRYADAQAAATLQVEQDVLDQINIIADWLKNRTGDGRHRELPDAPDHLAADLADLAAWLRTNAAEIIAHSGRSAPREALQSQLALALEIEG